LQRRLGLAEAIGPRRVDGARCQAVDTCRHRRIRGRGYREAVQA
jgi:hypothetical protein